MQNQNIIDYLRHYLTTGYSESALKQHLLANGWKPAQINDAFEKYHTAYPAKRSPKSKLRRQKTRTTQRPRSRSFVGIPLQLKLAVVAVLLLVVGGVTISILFQQKKIDQPIAGKVQLSFAEQQMADVYSVGGAVSQYTTANGGTLPVKVASTSPGSVSICGEVCDPFTSANSPLRTYKASGVVLKTYDPTLLAPDAETMYLVPGVRCSESGSLGNQVPGGRAMVILYMMLENNVLKQRCANL